MSEAPGLFADGKAYERLMGRWSRLAGRVFLDWLNLPKGLRWLDVGCGNGAFTETLIAHAAPSEVHSASNSQLAGASGDSIPTLSATSTRVPSRVVGIPSPQ